MSDGIGSVEGGRYNRIYDHSQIVNNIKHLTTNTNTNNNIRLPISMDAEKSSLAGLR
uniref:Uncharacterized protein n=1 Tax=Rhizophagus irregularis (strain DAOM 181602 / DAOM 197198 / MUCL 43194) TaxID=747089 RepID=U9TEF4_RHIID